jgi:hypothetical protein
MGVWKKLGGVFLEFDEEAVTQKKGAAPKKVASPSDLTGDADDLLAALEGRKPAPARPRRARAATPARPAAPKKAPADILTMDTTAVYARAAIQDNPNSADRILKMIGGLAAFPPEQQRAMVQALDAADPSWSEPQVLEDARSRQGALRSHLRAIEQDKTARVAAINTKQKQVEETGLGTLNEIDKQLAELQALRQQQVASTASQVQRLEDESGTLATSGEAARHSITDEINRLSGLMTFFTGAGPTA